jgi:ferredoxin
VKACPKRVIELRKKWPKNRAVYVSCVSKDKGAAVMKACKAGCIGCGKCEKACAFGAITVEGLLVIASHEQLLCNCNVVGSLFLLGLDVVLVGKQADDYYGNNTANGGYQGLEVSLYETCTCCNCLVNLVDWNCFFLLAHNVYMFLFLLIPLSQFKVQR